jgi:hypothetical protein
MKKGVRKWAVVEMAMANSYGDGLKVTKSDMQARKFMLNRNNS